MIPPVAHFIWFGPWLPWTHVLSIRSAVLRGSFEQVILHYSDDLSSTAEWAELQALPRFCARRIDVDALIGAIGAGAPKLMEIYAKLESPAAKANVLRAAILMGEGGVYLDLDTVTVRSFEQLRREYGAFVGEERVIFTAAVRRAQGLSVRADCFKRAAMREVHRRLPQGWRSFRSIEGRYAAAPSNAVIGAERGHPFIRRLLDGMIATPEARHLVRFALGTLLMHDVIASHREPDLRVLPPRWFYPLPPEISHHWFRKRRSLPPLDEVLSSDTVVVHWYASVRLKRLLPRINANYVRTYAERQLYSALVLPLLEADPG